MDIVVCDTSTLNNDTDNNNDTSNEHATSTAPCINGGANEWESSNTTDLGHRSDNTSTNADVSDIHEILEGLVGQQGTEERGVKTVGGGAEEAYYGEQIELKSNQVPRNRGLLEHCLGVVVIAKHQLGAGDVLLIQSRIFMLDDRVTILLTDVCHCGQAEGYRWEGTT